MRVENEPAQICFLQDIFKSRRVSAFRQPESGGLAPKRFAKDVAADQNLRADGFAAIAGGAAASPCVAAEAMSSSEPLRATARKRRKQIAFPLFDKQTAGIQRNSLRDRIPLSRAAARLSRLRSISRCGKIDRAVEITNDSDRAASRILQHGAERRRDRHRELERDAVTHEPLHHAKQRNIGFGDRLEEPVFLEKIFVLGMPNERQMRVENERERAGMALQNYGSRAIARIRRTSIHVLDRAILRIAQNPQSEIASQRAAEILEAIETFFDDVDAGRVAQTNGAIVAERGAGNDRDIRFAQQADRQNFASVSPSWLMLTKT